jgi:hypothetical protein
MGNNNRISILDGNGNENTPPTIAINMALDEDNTGTILWRRARRAFRQWALWCVKGYWGGVVDTLVWICGVWWVDAM